MQKQKGFTLIEILISIAILGALFTISVPNYLNFRNHRIMKSEIDKLTFMLIEAQENSRSQKNSNQWGVHFKNPAGDSNDFYEMWEGDSYSSGTVVSRVNLGNGVNFTSPADGASKDISFAKLTSKPSQEESVVLDKQEFTGVVFVGNLGQISSYLEDGLVGYWQFDEGSGTVARDVSGNSNNGNFYGTPTWQSESDCKRSTCLRFDAVEYVYALDSPSLNITDGLTILYWFNAATLNPAVVGAPHPVQKYASTLDNNFRNYYCGSACGSSGKMIWYANRNGAWGSISGASPVLATDTWYFIGVTYDNGGQLYWNGVPYGVKTGSGVLDTTTASLLVGSDIAGFDYVIDDVRIYNRALSAAEILSIYNATK